MNTVSHIFNRPSPNRISGVNLVCEKSLQHEKDISTTGAHFGELIRSGDYARLAQAGANFPQ